MGASTLIPFLERAIAEDAEVHLLIAPMHYVRGIALGFADVFDCPHTPRHQLFVLVPAYTPPEDLPLGVPVESIQAFGRRDRHEC